MMVLRMTRTVKIHQVSNLISSNVLWIQLLQQQQQQPSSKRDVSDYAVKAGKAANREGEVRVFMVAGEVSGDAIGSRLMSSFKSLSPLPLRFSGVGGSLMFREGLESIFPMEDISVMGIWELLPHLYKFRVRLKETVDAALHFQPHVVVTIDSKGFSFRFLKQLRARYSSQQESTIPIHFQYVAPSFWAWKGGEERLRGLVNFVDHLFCILPNEEAVCKSNGLAATFVGHPTLEDISELNLKANPSNGVENKRKCRRFQEEISSTRRSLYVSEPNILTLSLSFEGAMVISLLPGSRLHEVTRMLTIFAHTIGQLKYSYPELMTLIHVAPNKHVENYISGVVHNWPVPAVLVPGGNSHVKYDGFSASQIALCTSGTVALELQLARLPGVVAYRAHLLTEWFIKHRAKIPYVSLPNILMDSPIIPEALFEGCTPKNLASLLIELLDCKRLREEQIVAADEVVRFLFPSADETSCLGESGRRLSFPSWTPSKIAAATILKHLNIH